MYVVNPVSRTYIINKLIKDNDLQSYLEIGVSNPYTNYLKIKCKDKTSVDPCITCEYFSTESMKQFAKFITHKTTSDDFFEMNGDKKYDIIFIDGDHSYEQSLKDLNNALKVLEKDGFVVLHDAKPVDYNSTQISNFEKKLSYNGEVWKTVISAIQSNQPDSLKIGTFPYDFGVTVIKKLSDDVKEIKALDLDYYKDYSIPALNPIYDLEEFKTDKVSYFTPLYNTPQRSIERTTFSVLNQTNKHWEWVLYDDSNNEKDSERLRKYFESLKDTRIKYYRFNKQSGGLIGWSKKRAANLCTGKYLAELDHDDLLMPELTEMVLKNGDGFDFIYSNCGSIIINDDDSFSIGETYGPGFAMGYGSYRTTLDINPLTGQLYEYQECICCPINPKTIRHIVGVPNHVRIWNKRFYDSIGGHNENMRVVDDYELIVRSFISGGKFLHLDKLGYLQINTGDNTTDKRREEIQILVRSVLYKYNEKIKQEFELRNMEDWAYKYHQEHFGFSKEYHYWDVPTMMNADTANCKI